jgi:hypothetical protein
VDEVPIKSFDVSKEFLDKVRREAVPEEIAHEFPNAPIIVDVNKVADQYGLRPEQVEQLVNALIQGTGKVTP